MISIMPSRWLLAALMILYIFVLIALCCFIVDMLWCLMLCCLATVYALGCCHGELKRYRVDHPLQLRYIGEDKWSFSSARASRVDIIQIRQAYILQQLVIIYVSFSHGAKKHFYCIGTKKNRAALRRLKYLLRMSLLGHS